MLLLVPADPLRPRSPDPHFAPEMHAARDLGVDVCLVDHDALVAGDATAATTRSPESDDAVYRGWMMTAGQYEAFEAALRGRGVQLRTDAEAFRRAHELPGWYGDLEALTPKSAWSRGASAELVRDLCAQLGDGPAVLRDYVKSMKHYWHEACFVPDVADTANARDIAARFIELREDSFVGGLVLRQFEPLRGPEVRTWWVDGRLALVGPHPDTPDEIASTADTVPDVSVPILALRVPFVTVDFARHEDGRWRVVELGDGQVSDRPPVIPATELIQELDCAVHGHARTTPAP